MAAHSVVETATVPPPAPDATDPRRVVSPLDPDKVERLLHDLNILDHWQHVVEGLRSGFDVGVDTPLTRTFTFKNHASSEMDPEFIDTYIRGEVAAGRYSQGFEPEELANAIGHYHTSPLGLVPKPGTDKLRLVQDMSYPRNNPSIPSVNSGINSDDFPTEWGTFKDTSNLILTLPSGTLAAAFDISAAYRITPIRPAQQSALCLFWRGKVYVDRAVMFGLSSSAGVFGAIADMLVGIYKASGYGPIRKWVDDFLVFRLPGQSWTEDDFIALTADVGVPWGLKKTKPLAAVQRYIGFDWNLDAKTVSLPPDKLQSTTDLLATWFSEGARFSARDAARLHGKLVHVSCIFPLIRPFLRSIAHFAAHYKSPRALLRPSGPLLADLHWAHDLLGLMPNTLPLASPEPVDLNWWGDASSSFGIGVTVGDFWAVWKWADGVQVGPKCQYDIGWAEAVAIELGLLLVLQSGLVADRQPHQQCILVRSDNAGVVSVVNKGRSRAQNTNTVLKRIFTTLASQTLTISAQHIPGKENISDALSRGDISTFLMTFPHARKQFSLLLPPELQDKLVPW